MRKEAKEKIKKRLEGDIGKIKHQLNMNKYTMRNLVRDQTILKRELAIIGELLKMLS